MDNAIIQKNEYPKVWVFVQNNLNLFLSILLILIALVVYSPVFLNQFQLGWDDQVIVINGYTGGGLRPHNLWAILTQVYAGQYAPVNQFIYSVLYTLFGYDPFWFHLFSFLIHTANVLLVFSFIKRLLTETKTFDTTSKYRIAFVTALLMAIHPFLVESVAWISASKVLIYGLFYLAAMHFYLNYLKLKSIKYYVLIIIMFTLSFGAKEQAVTLPICFLLIDYTLKRNLKDPKIWIEKLPLFVLLLVFGYITLLSHSLKYAPASAQAPTYPFYQNVIFACYAISEYWIKCIVPFKLQYMYLYPNAIGQQLPLMFWVYPVALGLIIISFASFWKKRWIFFGLLFFLIHIVLVLNMIPMDRFAVMADRYVYLASVGIFFLMAYLIDQALSNKRYKYWVTGAGLIYLVFIGTYANQYSKMWHDSDKLKRDLKDEVLNRIELQQQILKK